MALGLGFRAIQGSLKGAHIMGVRIRGTVGDIDALNKGRFKKATRGVKKGPLSRVSPILPGISPKP